MPERPLLLFPEPESASRTKGSGGPGRYHYPSHDAQGNRLSPIFHNLQAAFQQRNVEIQQSTAGIDPEQVLVIETIGSVENFANAVKKIRGLEWLGEIEIDDIVPDEHFYEEGRNKKLKGRLYLILSNYRALQEMLSLWNTYSENQDMVFQRGLTKFRDVFKYLKDVRRWSVEDRLDDSGIIEYWQETLVLFPNEVKRFEAELWYRSSLVKRNQAKNKLESIINQVGGQIITECTIKQIGYHSILAELPASEIKNIIRTKDTELVKFDGIMMFRPVGQMTVKITEFNELTDTIIQDEPGETQDKPIIGLLDGLPISNHLLVKNRIIIDDPDDWAQYYPVSSRIHGTGMASLIINGDLNNGQNLVKQPIYCRPIMKPIGLNSQELVPDDILIVDLVHRAVKRIFEGDDGEEAVAPSIKVINFSIGDPSRQFNYSLSPLARLIDWLSQKYNVLFIISAGNNNDDILLDISKDEFLGKTDDEKSKIISKKILQDSRNRRLISPSESINAISVGSLHYDNAPDNSNAYLYNCYNYSFPSPFSPFGNGYRRAIKPEILYFGGKQLLKIPVISQSRIKLEYSNYSSAPGNKVAAPDSLGALNKTAYTRGTSNAAALISHNCAICHDSLQDIFDNQDNNNDFEKYSTMILKAMVVHGSRWGDIADKVKNVLQEPDRRKERKWIGRWIGYGVPDIERVLNCTKNRATVIGYGELNDEDAHIYKLPLPPSFSSLSGLRRLTVTLAWFSPTSAMTQKYRDAFLWFEVNKDLISSYRADADRNTVRRGTIQHEVFEGNVASPYSDDANIEIKVNCRSDASKIVSPIKYGLLVTFEIAEDINIEVYEEIRSRIATAIKIQNQV